MVAVERFESSSSDDRRRRGREKNRPLGPRRNRIGAPEPPRHLNPTIASPHRVVSTSDASFFVFARCCSPPPNQPTRPPSKPKQCAHQTLRVSLHDIQPCFDWHSRRRSNALCIAPFLLSGTSPSILPYFPARLPPTEPQRYETTMGLSGHSTPHSVLLEPFHPPIGLNAAWPQCRLLRPPRRDAHHEG